MLGSDDQNNWSTLHCRPCCWLTQCPGTLTPHAHTHTLQPCNARLPAWAVKWTALVLGFVDQERAVLPAMLLAHPTLRHSYTAAFADAQAAVSSPYTCGPCVQVWVCECGRGMWGWGWGCGRLLRAMGRVRTALTKSMVQGLHFVQWCTMRRCIGIGIGIALMHWWWAGGAPHCTIVHCLPRLPGLPQLCSIPPAAFAVASQLRWTSWAAASARLCAVGPALPRDACHCLSAWHLPHALQGVQGSRINSLVIALDKLKHFLRQPGQSQVGCQGVG